MCFLCSNVFIIISKTHFKVILWVGFVEMCLFIPPTRLRMKLCYAIILTQDHLRREEGLLIQQLRKSKYSCSHINYINKLIQYHLCHEDEINKPGGLRTYGETDGPTDMYLYLKEFQGRAEIS